MLKNTALKKCCTFLNEIASSYFTFLHKYFHFKTKFSHKLQTNNQTNTHTNILFNHRS